MSENTDILVKNMQDAGSKAPWWVWFIIDLLILILKCLLSAFVAGAIVFLAATQTRDWSGISDFAKNLIWLSAAVACAKDILSFLSTAVSDMQKRRAISVAAPTASG